MESLKTELRQVGWESGQVRTIMAHYRYLKGFALKKELSVSRFSQANDTLLRSTVFLDYNFLNLGMSFSQAFVAAERMARQSADSNDFALWYKRYGISKANMRLFDAVLQLSEYLNPSKQGERQNYLSLADLTLSSSDIF